MIQQPALDQQYSTLIDQLSQQNALFQAFVQGEADDTVALGDGRTIKSLSGVISDLTKFKYVQKVVDHRLYSDMISANTTLEIGLIVRIWGDTTTNNGLYLKTADNAYSKVSYSDLYDLNDSAFDMGTVEDTFTTTAYDMGTL